MKKVLFLIHDLAHGGAEKVLVNLVNNMDKSKFDITVMALFDVGVNRQFLNDDIKYKYVFKTAFPGNSKAMKLFSPKQLHKMFIKDKYDVEVAYLEGPSARVISGCDNPDTKLVSWLHCTLKSSKKFSASYRSYKEAINCYAAFDKNVFVSQGVKNAFLEFCNLDFSKCVVLYNTNDSRYILQKSSEEAPLKENTTNLCIVGKVNESKGANRLLNICRKLSEEKYNFHMNFFGIGDLKIYNKWCKENGIEQYVSFLGYQENPYKYVAKCDLFVCASYAEGFSTAATESLIVGTPVCTVEVSGMKEMLGENNEYGVVCDNDDDALYSAIKDLLDNPEKLTHYKKQAEIRGKDFSTEKTVKAVEELLLGL